MKGFGGFKKSECGCCGKCNCFSPLKNKSTKEKLNRLRKTKEKTKIPKITKEEIDTGDLKFYPETFV